MPAWFAWDNETALIEPGYQAPRLACSSISIVQVPTLETGDFDAAVRLADSVKEYYSQPVDRIASLVHWTQAERVFRQLFDGTGAHLVGANVSFDMRTLAERYPLLLPLILDMYDEGRIHDTQTAEQLLDIARGTLGRHPKTRAPLKYSLADQYGRITHERLDKDTWRLRYGELAPYDLKCWPEDARHYPMKDAVSTALVWSMIAIRAHMQRMITPGIDSPILASEPEQCRSDFALGATSCWGLQTNGPRVEALAQHTEEVLYELEEELALHGLIDGGAGTKTVKKVVHKFRKPYRRGEGVRNTKAAAARLLEAARAENPGVPDEDLPIERSEKTGEPSLSADACSESSDPLVQKYGMVGALSTLLGSTDEKKQKSGIPALRKGVHYPIHTRFGLAASGRSTSSNPNVQNLANKIKGVRECFQPRPGMVFAAADVGGLELATFAEVLLEIVGWSKLAEAILAGRDAHADFACEILGIPLEEGERRKALGKEADPEFYLARQTAKIGNFGIPGGLGAESLVDYARALYHITLTLEEAKRLKALYLTKWPEVKIYFQIIAQLAESGRPFKQLYSGRYRGGLKYTAACNTSFQGLGGDAMKHVAWELTKACYDWRQGSILLGCRIVNFIHDEFILEVPRDHLAHDRAMALGDMMNAHIRRYLRRVPARAEPLLMDPWSKDAKPVYGPDGRLIPWEPKKKLAP